MNKTLKWIIGIAAGLLILIVLAIAVAPFVINLNAYKPQIESLVSKAAGRPFTLGGDIKPSFFPWIGARLTDVHLGNAAGFKAGDFFTVKAFEVRVKLLPLLSRRIEVKRFVVKAPYILLEKDKKGRGNWEGLGSSSAAPAAKPQPAPKAPSTQPEGFGIKGLMVQTFAITGGRLEFVDHGNGTRKEVKDFNLSLQDVSFDTPIQLDFSAVVDNHPISVKGTIGPLGTEPGKTPIAWDLAARFTDLLLVKLNGRVENALEKPAFSTRVDIAAFSPRDLLAELKQALPFEPADPQVLKKTALSLQAEGNAQSIRIKDGKLILDDSNLTFDAGIKDFDKPDLSLTATLDQIDLDRYLPPPPEKKDEAKAPSKKEPEPSRKKDYTALRKLVLDARVKVGKLKASNTRLQDIEVKAVARNGVFRIDPLGLNLYQGRLAATGTMDVRGDQPKSDVSLHLEQVQAGPLLKDFLKKEMLEGALTAGIALQFSGDQADAIRKTLGGKGQLQFNDGAIVGIDIADMVRNVEAAFALGEKPAQKPRTDFAELVVPFSITKGLTNIDGSKMNSPLLRLLADGTADLAKEKLDMRITPKFVATLVGQGDKKDRAGFMVPVLVTGKLTDPSFKPDLKSILSQSLPGKENLSKDIEKTKKKVTQDIQKDLEKKTDELLKGLPFGTKK